jgi:replicative DNA helicase
MGKQLRDAGNERALLSSLVKYGKDAFVDADGIIDPTDFGFPINKAIYLSLRALNEDPNCHAFDIESIKMKIKTLGLTEYFQSNKDLEYLELLDTCSFDRNNIQMFALQIKKYAVARDLYTRYTDASKYLENITGNESLAEIIRSAENRIVDFVTGTDNGNALEQITENLEEYIKQALEEEVVDQVGLPTGFPIYDDAIGGGPRPGTVTMKGARPKTGKSFDALNTGLNVAKRGIPVFYLDTELTQSYQRNRLICIESTCPLYDFETRRFKHSKNWVEAVVDASKRIDNIPFYYQSISGMSHTEALALVRRWLVKHVGFKEDGTANDCLVIYDYMKLTSGAGLTSVTPEFILLGLMLTECHNFAVKYNIPILGYVQLNRDGIDAEDTSVVAGSDRILWLCSSLSIFKNKTEDDANLGCGFEHGNKKLVVLETRHGSGLEVDGDYINLKCSLRPNINKTEACGLIKEGFRRSEVQGSVQNVQKDKPRDATNT